MRQIASNCLTIGHLLTGTPYRLRCRDEQTTRGVRPVEDNSYSEDFRSDEPEGIDEVLDQYQEEWFFPRWRVKVEQERFLSRNIKDDD